MSHTPRDNLERTRRIKDQVHLSVLLQKRLNERIPWMRDYIQHAKEVYYDGNPDVHCYVYGGPLEPDPEKQIVAITLSSDCSSHQFDKPNDIADVLAHAATPVLLERPQRALILVLYFHVTPSQGQIYAPDHPPTQNSYPPPRTLTEKLIPPTDEMTMTSLARFNCQQAKFLNDLAEELRPRRVDEGLYTPITPGSLFSLPTRPLVSVTFGYVNSRPSTSVLMHLEVSTKRPLDDGMSRRDLAAIAADVMPEQMLNASELLFTFYSPGHLQP